MDDHIQTELARVVAALAKQFPERDETEIRRVVGETYDRLAVAARITSHLIPLTHNRARAALAAETGHPAPVS